MLNSEFEDLPTARVFRLSGVIDEDANLSQILVSLAKDRMNRIDLGNVTRISSLGVREWIQFFRGLDGLGYSYAFSNCPPAIVDQLNLFKGFQVSGEVLSIQIPFACSVNPSHQFVIETTTDSLRGQSLELSRKCAACGAPAELDDYPDAYFAFLNHER